MSTLQQCIDAFNARMAVRDLEADPIRVVSAAMLQTKAWRQDAGALQHEPYGARPGSQHWRCRELAETGELLGIERVGLAVDQREDSRG